MFATEVGFYKAVIFLIVAIFVFGVAISLMNGDMNAGEGFRESVSNLIGG